MIRLKLLYLFIPAVLCGGFAYVVLAEADKRDGHGGGPPMIDFGPLFEYLFALALFVGMCVALSWGVREYKAELGHHRGRALT